MNVESAIAKRAFAANLGRRVRCRGGDWMLHRVRLDLRFPSPSLRTTRSLSPSTSQLRVWS
jgi:hypothetical protein